MYTFAMQEDFTFCIFVAFLFLSSYGFICISYYNFNFNYN